MRIPNKASRTFTRGDTVQTSFGFPAVVAGRSAKMTTMCEVFGMAHETGSVYTEDLEPISQAEIWHDVVGTDSTSAELDDDPRWVVQHVYAVIDAIDADFIEALADVRR